MDKQNESAYECSVCLLPFNIPKSISCGHTFCQQCLENIEKTFDLARLAETFPCPVCRKTIELPLSGSVGDFPVNYAILQAIEGNDKQSYCPQHKKSQDLFCRSCEVCICADCFLLEHTSRLWLYGHKVTSSTTVAGETVAQLNLASEVLKVQRFKEIISKTEQKKQTNTENAEFVIEEINKQREQMIQEIRCQADELVNIVKKVADDKNQKIEKIKKENEEMYLINLETAERYSAHAEEIGKRGLSQVGYNKAKDMLRKNKDIEKYEGCNTHDMKDENDKTSEDETETEDEDTEAKDGEAEETTKTTKVPDKDDKDLISTTSLHLTDISSIISFVKNQTIERPIKIGWVEFLKTPADMEVYKTRDVTVPSFTKFIINKVYALFHWK